MAKENVGIVGLARMGFSFARISPRRLALWVTTSMPRVGRAMLAPASRLPSCKTLAAEVKDIITSCPTPPHSYATV